MEEPIRFALLGLGVGAAYALAALGIVVIYRGSGVLNFAHGAMAVVGAYAFVELREEMGLPLVVSIVGGVLIASVTGVITHVAIMRPLRRASALARLIATLGVFTLLLTVANLLDPDVQVRFVDAIFPTWVWEPISGAPVGIDRILLFGVAVVLAAVLFAVYRWTRFGLATAAVSENQRAAAVLAHSPDLIAAGNWAIGAGLAGLAGILIVPITGLAINQLGLIVIPALAAALVGGFSSFLLTLVGGVGIGVVQSEMARYVSAQGWSTAFPFLVIIAVLVLSGRALPLRSVVRDRLPGLGTGEVRPLRVVVTSAVVVFFLTGATTTWVDAFTTSFITGLVALSLVVVTGYAGQLSLAQFALAGMGAFIGARLADVHGIPFELALVVGVVGTIPVGILVALPALRTRGVNLAVATLGLALAIEQLILQNPDYTGGLPGTNVGVPSLFGWSIDSIAHPERYGLLAFAMLVVAALAVANLRRGRAGRRLVAVRGNERAAASLGISVMGAKLYAFALGAAIAASAGILIAFRNPHVNFAQFGIFRSIDVVVLSVIGGVGYVLGAFIAALLVPAGVLPRLVAEIGNVTRLVPLALAVILIAVLLGDSNGLANQLVKLRQRWAGVLAARSVTARVPWLAGPARWLRGFRDGRLARVPGVGRLAGRGDGGDGEGGGGADDVTIEPVPPAVLEVRDIAVHFGGVVAVERASLTVGPGETVGLIGPNGAGKTTLIDAVTGFAPLHSGSVVLNGRAIDRWSPKRRSRAGIARSFQSLELFDDMTVRDNLRTASDSRDARAYLTDLVRPGRPPLPPAAMAAVQVFGLEGDLDRYPQELPYGRRRLVAIARAVAGQPSVLLLDEPAAGLDDGERAELGVLMRRLAEEWRLGIVLVEHDVQLVMQSCDRIVTLNFGRQIAQGTPEEIESDPAVVAAYLGEADADEIEDAGPAPGGRAGSAGGSVTVPSANAPSRGGD